MNSELQKLIDTVSKYNATYWIIFKGKEKDEYYEGSDLQTSISELEIAFEGLTDGAYIFKCREGKSSYNSQLVRKFSKGSQTNTQNTNSNMDTQAMILFTQTLAEIKLRQEQMHLEMKDMAKAVILLTDKNKDNDGDGISMLKNISEGVKVMGSLKDLFPKNA